MDRAVVYILMILRFEFFDHAISNLFKQERKRDSLTNLTVKTSTVRDGQESAM